MVKYKRRKGGNTPQGDLKVVTFKAIYGYLPVEDIDSQKVGENFIEIEFEF